jgi:hypothetical protein
VTQRVVVVEVLAAQAQTVHALPGQSLNAVLDAFRIAVIGETSGQLAEDPRRFLHRAQPQPTRLRGDRPTVKSRHDFSAAEGVKFQRLCAALCSHRPSASCGCMFF